MFFGHLKCVRVEDMMDQMFLRSEEHLRRHKVFSQ